MGDLLKDVTSALTKDKPEEPIAYLIQHLRATYPEEAAAATTEPYDTNEEDCADDISGFEMCGVKISLLQAIANLAKRIGGDWTVGRISNELIGT